VAKAAFVFDSVLSQLKQTAIDVFQSFSIAVAFNQQLKSIAVAFKQRKGDLI